MHGPSSDREPSRRGPRRLDPRSTRAAHVGSRRHRRCTRSLAARAEGEQCGLRQATATQIHRVRRPTRARRSDLADRDHLSHGASFRRISPLRAAACSRRWWSASKIEMRCAAEPMPVRQGPDLTDLFFGSIDRRFEISKQIDPPLVVGWSAHAATTPRSTGSAQRMQCDDTCGARRCGRALVRRCKATPRGAPDARRPIWIGWVFLVIGRSYLDHVDEDGVGLGAGTAGGGGPRVVGIDAIGSRIVSCSARWTISGRQPAAR